MSSDVAIRTLMTIGIVAAVTGVMIPTSMEKGWKAAFSVAAAALCGTVIVQIWT